MTATNSLQPLEIFLKKRKYLSMTYTFYFPTTEVNSAFRLSNVRHLLSESAYDFALWHYNNSLSHDGFPPVTTLPKGTTVKDMDGRMIVLDSLK